MHFRVLENKKISYTQILDKIYDDAIREKSSGIISSRTTSRHRKRRSILAENIDRAEYQATLETYFKNAIREILNANSVKEIIRNFDPKYFLDGVEMGLLNNWQKKDVQIHMMMYSKLKQMAKEISGQNDEETAWREINELIKSSEIKSLDRLLEYFANTIMQQKQSILAAV